MIRVLHFDCENFLLHSAGPRTRAQDVRHRGQRRRHRHHVGVSLFPGHLACRPHAPGAPGPATAAHVPRLLHHQLPRRYSDRAHVWSTWREQERHAQFHHPAQSGQPSLLTWCVITSILFFTIVCSWFIDSERM